MGIIDWSIVVVLAFFFVFGLRKGFAAMIVQLLGYLALFLLVGQYFPLLKTSLIAKFTIAPALATVTAFILIAALIFIVGRLVLFFLHKALKQVKLSLVNRLLGGLFGLLNALLVLMILMVLLDYVPSISKPLKDKNLHAVYAFVDQLKNSTFSTLKLKQHLEMLEQRVERKVVSGLNPNDRD